jgi:hypothetical protein
LIVPFWPHVAYAAADSGPACGNERYEDFFKIQYEKEKADREREKYAGEIKAVRAAAARKMEQARLSYHREKKVDDAAGEKAFEESVKADKARNEANRRLYVMQRDKAESSSCHPLKIPELKEYDLENY